MRKSIAAALIAALALTLYACGGYQPSSQTEQTTAGLTNPLGSSATETPTTSTVVTSEEFTTEYTATAATTMPASTARQTTSRKQTTSTTARLIITTTVPATPGKAFGGAEILLAGPSRGIDESLSKSPHTVYAVDMGGRRFDFQPQAYNVGGIFAVDVYLDNQDGSFTQLDTFTCDNPGVDGKYSIVLITPNSKITKDERQNLMLVENVYRFELSPADERYSVRLLASHAPYPLTAYYALDTSRVGGFVKYTP